MLSSFVGTNHFILPAQVNLQASAADLEMLSVGKGSSPAPYLVQREVRTIGDNWRCCRMVLPLMLKA